MPPRIVEYRGTSLAELDLDQALALRPELLLVDELAHSNAAGSRHTKRWQDVMELLDAGINVYTTVNVQHLESLNDVIAQITGVIVRETVPDSILERADAIELIDIPEEELLTRLHEGKVYIPSQAARAAEGFFRKGNLIALRELALRSTAERVDQQMRGYMRAHGIAETWPVADHILVCVGPSPLSARLIRATRRIAAGLKAEWVAVTVETPAQLRMSERDRARVGENLSLAEKLGARIVRLAGERVADEVLAYARHNNVTKIVVGKPTHPRWRDFVYGSMLDDIVRGSGDIDVHVISGELDQPSPAPSPAGPVAAERPPIRGYVWGTLITVLTTTIGFLLVPHSDLANLIMIYLLGVVLISARYGYGPSVVSAILSVAAFDFFFVPPYFTFAVSNLRYIVTFAIMLIVGLTISYLTARIRDQVVTVREREQRTAALYAMSRELVSLRGADTIAQAAALHIHDVFSIGPRSAGASGSEIVVLLPGAEGKLSPRATSAPTGPGAAAGSPARASLVIDARELAVAEWAFGHEQPAGRGTETLPSADAMYLPLMGTAGAVGVLGVRGPEPRWFVDASRRDLLETFANQTALAIERAMLAEEAQRAQLMVESEKLRNALLSSVSHDLRTPLGVITGATSTLLDDEVSLDPGTRRDLIQTAYEEARRLERLVRNLLDMMRVESGAIEVHKEWQPLEEVIGSALERLSRQLGSRPVTTRIDADVPLVPIDGVLIEQVLINLLENAIKHTPPDGPIDISASAAKNTVTVTIADRGPGIAAGQEDQLFEKYYRAPGRIEVGFGLGLTICRGIIATHGGRVWAENRPGGGAAFSFTIPVEGTPPTLDMVEPRPSDPSPSLKSPTAGPP
jgi:two-component system sensor histidine kinase KdpD